MLYEQKPSAARLRAIVNSGETVLHNGVAIRDTEKLPTALDLAEDSKSKSLALGDLARDAEAAIARFEAAKKAAGAKTPKAPKTGTQTPAPSDDAGDNVEKSFAAKLQEAVGDGVVTVLALNGLDTAEKIREVPDSRFEEIGISPDAAIKVKEVAEAEEIPA